MSVNCTSLGKRISFYRSKSNLSQEALAAKINCSREHIVRIENGTKIPSISVLVEIANTLSVSADELLLDCVACDLLFLLQFFLNNDQFFLVFSFCLSECLNFILCILLQFQELFF